MLLSYSLLISSIVQLFPFSLFLFPSHLVLLFHALFLSYLILLLVSFPYNKKAGPQLRNKYFCMVFNVRGKHP